MTYKDFSEHVLCGREIEFDYQKVNYIITDYNNTATLENCDTGDKIYFGEKTRTLDDRFNGRKMMLKNAIFNGKRFEEIFDQINIQWVL